MNRATSSLHTCAIGGSSPSAFCWGDDRSGQLGDGESAGNCGSKCPSGRSGPLGLCISATPVPVEASNGSALAGVSSLVAGEIHSCALGGGNVQCCWGDNGGGQLGDGKTSSNEPCRANPNDLGSSILDAPAAKISAGGFHTCAVMQDHTARCWGDNQSDQIGNGVPCRNTNPSSCEANTSAAETVIQAFVGNPPRPVPLTNVKTIAAGQWHTCALLPLGTVECWGEGNEGEPGRSDTTLTPLPVVVLDSAGTPGEWRARNCSRGGSHLRAHERDVSSAGVATRGGNSGLRMGLGAVLSTGPQEPLEAPRP
jgi:alpha-tubulin suppressor-like RCC1 family protein